MPIVKKIQKDDLPVEEQKRLEVILNELESRPEYIVLGNETFSIESFNISDAVNFAPFQEKWRKVISENPNATMAEILQSRNYDIISDILKFLGINVDIESITMKQFKYLMWLIAKKNYLFTEIPDSNIVNIFHPFSVIQ